ncbi:TraB/GumN family protein [Pontibacter sp. SGAir0037]|uniref:TraB/GumN family protein n=1 Tax=Pontibacter sp. SGAir0037 TaxID=2571030 RepID=UPI00143D0B89|nr:TraB/GumN family protein [Pontibacter sp. SGAir0037]
MKKLHNLLAPLYLFICLNLFCLHPVSGQNTNKKPKALLWEISGNGLAKPSYLFGTIHAICPDVFVLPDQVKAKLQTSEQLALEIDMDDPKFMSAIQQGALMSSGGIRDLYTEEQYKVLHSYFTQTMHIDISQLDKMKPFMLNSMLMMQMTDCQPESYEQTLLTLAKAQGKEVIGVETVQEQIKAFDNIPYKVQAEMLLESVTEMDKAKANYKKMVQLYLAQDLYGLEELLKEDYKGEYDVFEDALFTQRNLNWIPVIAREAKAKATFFAVGAGHLTGEGGILELLRQKGYTLTPVP